MLEGKHFQNAYVTRNNDQAIAEVQACSNIRKLIQTEVTVDVWTPKGQGSISTKLALIWVDDLQYEIIQPIGGDVELYVDALQDDGRPQFHHICMRVNDWEEFRQRVDQQPFPVVLEGGSDALKFIYLDARALLGHFLEYTWMTEERWIQMGGRG
ncbi:VOC family protein [uncultured Zhongshania sp.]|uniref:VOC family protein n=1 Tax=uncultured Zhongshania sp. TaxID=1642288 RepID=UPI0030D8E1EF|tara:strand:- start:765 stop:1229 length:465 start_codon:yes stop_codon:yes gene_type:complete